MPISEFKAALENAILRQKEQALICHICGKTRIEHYFKASQTCGSLESFEQCQSH